MRMTSLPTNSSHQNSAAEEALEWFARLKSGDATQAERTRFQSWLAVDIGRKREFDKLSGLWADLDATRPLFAEELVRIASCREHSDRERAGRRFGRRTAWISAVAACLGLVIMGGWYFMQPETASFRTAKGEQRTITLADGSSVMLNTDTIVDAELSRSRRSLILHRGEALFTVSHERDRPFEVQAGLRVIRDVGTKFAVRRDADNVTVAVIEGAVEVQGDKDGKGPGWRLLTAGEQVSYDRGDPLSPVGEMSGSVATAWTKGKVSFEDRSLGEVVREFSRYHEGEVRILDPKLADLKVSGVFGINERLGFFKALESVVPVTVVQAGKGLFILEGRKNSPHER
ncbi:putative FecR, ferric citrate sensor [Nitrospira sp. KM1]|uniref:FecR family protein n=1 Tax=Nitrospira sp. KM1 TaxID=1936990 RepID=UPI0013A79783|nr:FecR family protein [Nitrospira sp. KM1]BCA56525.1 putative FecR, ferric citrate sensor [Nitrospira sp. KM1]